jgi:hypothetical protein
VPVGPSRRARQAKEAVRVTVTPFLSVDDVIEVNPEAFGPGIVASRLLHRGMGGVFIVRSFRWASWLPRVYRVSEVLRDGQLDAVALYVRSESAHHRARRCAARPGAAAEYQEKLLRRLCPPVPEPREQPRGTGAARC